MNINYSPKYLAVVYLSYSVSPKFFGPFTSTQQADDWYRSTHYYGEVNAMVRNQEILPSGNNDGRFILVILERTSTRPVFFGPFPSRDAANTYYTESRYSAVTVEHRAVYRLSPTRRQTLEMEG